MGTIVVKGGNDAGKALDTILAKLDKAGTLRVGFLEGATYPDGTPVAQIAAIQEFGAPAAGIPPRPFFRRMIEGQSPKWAMQFGKIAKAADYNFDTTMGRFGELVKGQLQKSIGDLTSPALAPATVAKKGFDKPLIESGHMQNSVDYEIST